MNAVQRIVTAALLVGGAGGLFAWQLSDSAAVGLGDGAEAYGPPVLIELFTSEGCSSCPPADALVRDLQAVGAIDDVPVIVLAEHVDYWNYLGWQDRFSSADFSLRQSFYAAVLDSDVYSPQMVVDGQVGFVGSDRRRARRVVKQARRTAKVPVSVQLVEAPSPDSAPGDVRLTVSIDATTVVVPRQAEVMLAITEDNLATDVERGENRGRVLRHDAVVRHLESIGQIDAGPSRFDTDTVVPLDAEWVRPELTAVVFVQDASDRHILGAGRVRLD